MNPPKEAHVRLSLDDIFQTACDLPTARRAVYLDEACAGDEKLRRKVETMLRHHDEDGDFLEIPAVEDAFREIAEQIHQSGQYRQAMIGRQIGNYRILALLGKGGMGEVYLAHDDDLDVDVAMKFLTATYAADPEWQARFNREGRLNADLTHQNIAALRHKGQFEGRPFLVFEYVPGQTLDEKLHNGPLPLSEALPIFLQLAAGLAHAHSRKIIHRDLKPANIKVTPEGQVKILDFGIARRITTDLATVEMKTLAPEEQLTRDFGETIQGEVIGTVAYMSPEQTRGELLDEATDVWSLASVMFQTLTGRLPFKGVDTYDTLNLIRDPHNSPDWRALPANTPKKIFRLLQRCFAKSRQGRSPSAAIIAETIDQLLSPAIKRWKRIALTATAIFSIATAVFLWLWANRISPPAYLAVLPFNETGETLKIGEGLAKSLRDSLATATNLTVLPYSGTGEATLANMAPDTLIKAMGVQWLLTGNVQRNGDEVEVRIRLLGNRNQPPIESSIKGSRQHYSELLSTLTNRVSGLLRVAAPKPRSLGFQNEEKYLAAVALLQADLTENLADQAITLLEELAQTEPEPARAHAMLARVYLRKAMLAGKDRRDWVSKAEKASEEAIKLAPDLHEVKVTRGIMKAFEEENDEAIAILNDAWHDNPDDSVAALELARTYEENRQDDVAEQTYKAILARWPGYWLGHHELSYFYFHRGRFAEAQEETRQVLLINPNNLAGWVNSGNIQLELGDYQQAEQTFRYLLNTRNDLSTGEQASNWLGVGIAQIFQQRYVDAVESFHQALALDKDSQDPTLWAFLGDAQREIGGEARAAYNAYTTAIQIRRQVELSPTGKARLAELYAKRSTLGIAGPLPDAKDRQIARDTIQQVLNQQPENGDLKSDALYAVIKTCVFLDEEPKALRFVERALKAGVGKARFENDPQLKRLRQNAEYQQMLLRSQQSR